MLAQLIDRKASKLLFKEYSMSAQCLFSGHAAKQSRAASSSEDSSCVLSFASAIQSVTFGEFARQ